MRLTLVLVVDLPEGGAAACSRYEALVLPLLPRHGGRLERRLRSADGRSEVHVVSFADRAGYQAYLADPERREHRAVLAGAEPQQRLLEVHDVPEEAVVQVGACLRVALRSWGAPDAPPMVLLHALGDDASSWEQVARRFAERSIPQELLAEVVRAVPDGRLVTLPVGHGVHAAAPDAYAEVVMEWLGER